MYGYRKYCRLWMYASDALQAPLKGHEEIVANSPICLADDVLVVLHRLRALVSNLWHPHHAGNSFAWEGEQDLAFWFSRSEVSRLTGLEQAINWSPTVNLLLRLGIDLAYWAEIESPDGEKLPETPALQWAQQHHVLAQLFPGAQWLGNENWIERAVDYALHMLALLRSV